MPDLENTTLRNLLLVLIGLVYLSACSQADVRRELVGEAAEFLERRPAATGKVVEIQLTAAPTRLELLNGRMLDVWAYNGSVPGPTIRAREGDTIRVHFKNELPQPTTVHWHGIRLPNGMDGVPGVTQPAVQPGESFIYEFLARDPGTFWFHPHVRGSEQLERGLYGVLIIEEAQPPSVREILWVLDDWRLDESGQIDPRFVTRSDLAHDGRWGSVITVNGMQAPQVEVAAGERVRLRILNAANGRVFRPDLSGLDAKMIAFDGLTTKRPLLADGVELAPGNRVDLDLLVPPSPGLSIPVIDRFTRRPNYLATLQVADAAANVAASAPIELRGFVPEWRRAEGVEPELKFRLNAARGGPYGLQWMINGEVMHHDADQPMSMWHEPPYALRAGRWVKLRFINESARLHPMHLHGQFFKVVARDGRPVDEEHWRDTVLVRSRETVDIALIPTELGNWMLHCHIMEHQDAGMMTLVAVE